MVSLKRFAGGRGPAVSIEAVRALTDTTAFIAAITPIYNEDGTLDWTPAGIAVPTTTEWLHNAPHPASYGGRYWLRFASVSGESTQWSGLTGTNLNTWYQLSVVRVAGFIANGANNGVSVWDADIASDSAGATIVGTTRWTITLTATA